MSVVSSTPAVPQRIVLGGAYDWLLKRAPGQLRIRTSTVLLATGLFAASCTTTVNAPAVVSARSPLLPTRSMCEGMCDSAAEGTACAGLARNAAHDATSSRCFIGEPPWRQAQGPPVITRGREGGSGSRPPPGLSPALLPRRLSSRRGSGACPSRG